MKKVYLDAAAANKIDEEVLKTMIMSLKENYGNASALHQLGYQGEKALTEARSKIAASINAPASSIVFTSGGTEANNLVILGAVKTAGLCVGTAIEHQSVIQPLQFLKKQGYQVQYIKVDQKGYIDWESLKALLRQKIAVLSVILTNNEVGTIQDLRAISAAVKADSPQTLIHTDCVQAWGYQDIDVKKLEIDFLTLSAHKVGGPKGIGALYIKNKQKIIPQILGGGQENNLRSGTENIPTAVAFGALVTKLPLREQLKNMMELKLYFKNKLSQKIEALAVNGPNPAQAAPHILNLSFLGVKSHILVQALSKEGIYCSSQAACSSFSTENSHVLRAMGLSQNRIDSAIRFSLSKYTSKEDLDYAIAKIDAVVKHLRRVWG